MCGWGFSVLEVQFAVAFLSRIIAIGDGRSMHHDSSNHMN